MLSHKKVSDFDKEIMVEELEIVNRKQ